MQINYQDLLKEQAVFIALPILLIVAFFAGLGYTGNQSFVNIKKFNENSAQVETLTQKKADLERQLASQQKEEADPNTKKIFAPEGGFGADASFAPLFDNMLTIAKTSGIKIRSVDYNYSPEQDPVFAAKIDGINVCEFSATIVGKYSEIQTFLKAMLSENYLVNMAELEIVSWQRDKSVLIANIKLRFYTKTKV